MNCVQSLKNLNGMVELYFSILIIFARQTQRRQIQLKKNYLFRNESICLLKQGAYSPLLLVFKIQ